MIVYCKVNSAPKTRRGKRVPPFVSKIPKVPAFQTSRLDNFPSMCNTMFHEVKEQREMLESVIRNIKTPGRMWLVY